MVQMDKTLNIGQWRASQLIREVNAPQKAQLLNEWQVYDNLLPEQYRNEWASGYPTYVSYLEDEIEFSPRDYQEMDRIRPRAGDFHDDYLEPNQQLTTSSEWYQTVYNSNFFPADMNLQLYIIDAAILISRYEAARNWLLSFSEQIDQFQKEADEARAVFHWYNNLAGEHPLIYQQGNQSSSFFFATMHHYVVTGRARTLQEAINLYYQEW